MITTCNLMGGLGNQLFQVFATISYSLQTNTIYKFLQQDQVGNRLTAWNTLLCGLQNSVVNSNYFPTNLLLVKEPEFTYNKLPHIPSNHICLFGYFQSEKYFKEHYEKIYNLTKIEDRRNELMSSQPKFEMTTISLHFRIGDYKNIQHIHPIMTIEYYMSALSYIQSKITGPIQIVYFCEDSDLQIVLETIKALEIHYPEYTFVRCNPILTDWQQMLYMSCCHSHIIANSTFSWWGAYLNPSKEKIVCYPANWFGPVAKTDARDLCPLEWIKI